MCAYLRLDSVDENIEGDANFHHLLGNRVKLKFVEKGIGIAIKL